MSDGKVWQLVTTLSNGAEGGEIYGSYEVLHDAIVKWERFVQSGEPTDQRLLHITGFMDTLDRAEIERVIDLQGVSAMTLLMFQS